MTKNLYVLGYPVGHSKSPAMFNAVFEQTGIDWHYGLMSRETEQEARAFLNEGAFVAINVTTPYKQLAFSVAAQSSVAAQLACGANVLVSTPGGYIADSTDGVGAVSYLEREGASLASARVAVCGTGPAARSIFSACAFAGARCVTLLGRDGARAEHVLEEYLSRLAAVADDGVVPDSHTCACVRKTPREVLEQTTFAACSYGDERAGEAIRQADIVVDATTLGMNPGDPAPFDTALLHAGQVAFDVVYAHGETAFIAGARAAGCVALDGEGMLVAQAVAAVNDIASVYPAFDCSHLDLFAVMAQAAGFDKLVEGNPSSQQ